MRFMGKRQIGQLQPYELVIAMNSASGCKNTNVSWYCTNNYVNATADYYIFFYTKIQIPKKYHLRQTVYSY